MYQHCCIKLKTLNIIMIKNNITLRILILGTYYLICVSVRYRQWLELGSIISYKINN